MLYLYLGTSSKCGKGGLQAGPIGLGYVKDGPVRLGCLEGMNIFNVIFA